MWGGYNCYGVGRGEEGGRKRVDRWAGWGRSSFLSCSGLRGRVNHVDRRGVGGGQGEKGRRRRRG